MRWIGEFDTCMSKISIFLGLIEYLDKANSLLKEISLMLAQSFLNEFDRKHAVG